jgi:5-methyltetrahydrofolate--homocysteine methyltransferase
MDLLDQPDAIDRAMASARQVFAELWQAIADCVGPGGARRLTHILYSPEGSATLQCDFSCMMSPPHFDRWVMPALEEEAALVKHALYHWDGPGALVHERTLLASRGLHTFQYVPGAGRGTHSDYVPLLQRVQAAGKAVEVRGSHDELKQLHRQLRPEKTLYRTWAASPDEAEALLEWFRRNT